MFLGNARNTFTENRVRQSLLKSLTSLLTYINISYHHIWEFWAYNVIFGLFQAPYYCYAQTMTGELSPPGYEGMFFGLFGLSNRTSSMVGPNVIQAIIDKTGNNWSGFPFLFALSATASMVIWLLVDVEKGPRDAETWSKEMRGKKIH